MELTGDKWGSLGTSGTHWEKWGSLGTSGAHWDKWGSLGTSGTHWWASGAHWDKRSSLGQVEPTGEQMELTGYFLSKFLSLIKDLQLNF